jgi:hypothetical protein
MSYEQQLKRPLTRLLEASTCTEANLKKDIHWLYSRSSVKWGLYESLIITDCFNKKIILKSCKNKTAEWVTQTFIQHFIRLMSFYHNSFKLRHSVCEQSMKESLSTFKDCIKNVHHISLKTDEATEQMNQNVELYICMFFNYS